MLQVDVQKPSPEPLRPQNLADLSRNASVISSSSSSSTSSLLLKTPRPRPIRTFSSPRSRSRESPSTPRSSKPPSYLAKELGYADADKAYNTVYNSNPSDLKKRAQSRSKSRGTKSRNSSVGLRVQANDFEFGEILGEGSYSTVMHAIYPATGQEYAIKVLDKGHLKRNNKLQTALAEKNTLVRLGSGHPGIVRLHWAFHDEWSLYFVLDLAKNGELQTRISRLGSLSLECSKFYAAQIVDAVAYMHSKDVIHRDLKPENLLLDDAMRIKITDFGTGKILDPGVAVERAGTFVGTAQYVSPELLATNTTYKSSDLWAVGCIIYQMIAGRFPFHGLSEYLTWQKIKNLEYTFPDGFDEEAKDLVEKLLMLNPTERLGAGDPGMPNDMAALRSHPFFKSINWSTIWSDPAPPMEAGLVKREQHPHSPLADGAWEDVGAAWDNLVGGVGSEEEEESLEDGEEEEVQVSGDDGQYHPHYTKYQDYPPHYLPPEQGMPLEIGPLDDIPPRLGADEAEARGRLGGVLGVIHAEPDALSVPIDMPQASRGSIRTGSTTSSSEGSSPVDRLSAALEVMKLSRGRDRVQTPIQLTIPAFATESPWLSILLPGETLLHYSFIQVYQRPRRLTASLLPKSVAASTPKLKKRSLILTNRRLVCAKLRSGRPMTIKTEAFFTYPKETGMKEKDRDFVVDVTPIGGKEFTVMTTSKPQLYQAIDALGASRWVNEIRTLLQTSTSTNGSLRPQSASRP